MASPATIGAWVAVGLAAALVILATMKVRRTKGRIWQYHAGYAAVVAVLVLLLPGPVKVYVFSPAGVAVAGMIFPVYQSLRALCTPATVDDMEWLQYWCAEAGVYFITAYLKDYKLASDSVQLAWFQFVFFFSIWLYLPFTDGSTLIFDFLTRPILSPIVDPITEKMNNWIQSLINAVVSASHLYFLWFFFIILPKGLKRFVTIAVGTVYPLLSSITAVTTPEKTDDTYWLTFWSCYAILFLLMDFFETWLGIIPGFYTVVIFSTVYLMLPMFQGSEKIFRNILVPLAGLKESLLLRDAVLLKKDLMASLPPERQVELRRLITYSFNTETPDDDDDDNAHDDRLEVTAENAKLVLSWASSPWSMKAKTRRISRRQEGVANESTSLV